jgi:hypothetical protein
MKKIKVKIYNSQYAFEETLQFNFDDEFDAESYDYWVQFENIDCPISDIKPNHVLYGWMECYGQGANMLDIDFTHIKLTIEEIGKQFLDKGYFYCPYIIEQEDPKPITITEEQKSRYNKPVSNVYYGKVTFGGNKEGGASGDATCLENKVDGE